MTVPVEISPGQLSQPICRATSVGTPWPAHNFPALRSRATQWSPSARYSVKTGGSNPFFVELVAHPAAQACTCTTPVGGPNFAVSAEVSPSTVHGGCGGAGADGAVVVAGASVVEGATPVVVVDWAVVALVSPVWRACTPSPPEPHAAAPSASAPTKSPVVISRRRIGYMLFFIIAL